ncbi:MAG: LodA/GoxA family CTQ-dependent oxidase [Acidobacteriota bacterium]
MTPTYKIHPGIGVARVGNSPTEFYISPEKPGALPTACDDQGNPLMSPDGESELTVKTFKDSEGRIKRQAARFQIWVYDKDNPEGRPLEIGDEIRGGGNDGKLVDIQWRVYLANKKSSWYDFDQLQGEHGYASNHRRRNPQVEDAEARNKLIIDPGPRIVNTTDRRHARFDRDSGDVFAATFPPENLEPCPIDTLGELKTDNRGRLLVLGGHGHSGTYLHDEFGQPRIDSYANTDGWFDDISDGPVMARLVMFESRVNQVRFIDVEYPAWAVVGYPSYAPEILDMVTMDDVLEDLSVRKFATRPDLYGTLGTFDDPERIDPTDTEALIHWRAGRVTFNDGYKPWFYRDIWPILFRPDEFTYLTTVLGQSNFPHNQSPRGTFDPYRLGVPPITDMTSVDEALEEKRLQALDGRLLKRALAAELTLLERSGTQMLKRSARRDVSLDPDVVRLATEMFRVQTRGLRDTIKDAAKELADAIFALEPPTDFDDFTAAWKVAFENQTDSWKEAEKKLDAAVEAALDEACERADAEAQKQGTEAGHLIEELKNALREAIRLKLARFVTGQLLTDARDVAEARHTYDPYRSQRRYLYDLLRQPGEENLFEAGGNARKRTYNLPLMPLLCGDNPLNNDLPSKFLRLTDLQLFLLRQWERGHFFNEDMEGWADPDPWEPYAEWENKTAHDLDRGVVSQVLGGAFCPGGEISWIMRNVAVYHEPYRFKADETFYAFRQTAAQANANRGTVSNDDYASYVDVDLSQDNDFDTGLQPGDVTKYMAVPWQADFNECTSQPIDVTYESWNTIYPASDGDSLMKREQRVWDTLWWPAHRPIQVFTDVTPSEVGSPTYRQIDWAIGVPGTLAGDLKMTTEWAKLSFIVRNPSIPDTPSEMPPVPKYVAVERTDDSEEPCT